MAALGGFCLEIPENGLECAFTICAGHVFGAPTTLMLGGGPVDWNYSRWALPPLMRCMHCGSARRK